MNSIVQMCYVVPLNRRIAMGCLRIDGWFFIPYGMIFIDLKDLSGVWWVIAIIWTVLSVAGVIGGVYANYATGQMMQQLNTETIDLMPTIAP